MDELMKLLEEAEICLEAENLMARHCYYHAACWNTDELDTYWVREDKDVRWTQGMGRRTSLAAFRATYGLGCEANCLENYKYLLKKYPQVEGRDPRPLLEMAVHTLTTPVIEVADDHLSCKAFWYTPGSISSNLNWTEQKEGRWMWERYAVDFKKEDGEFRFQRASVYADLMAPMDAGSWIADENAPAGGPGGPGPGGEEDGPQMQRFPHDTPGDFHAMYAPTQMPQAEPLPPVPYATMADTFHY